MDTATSLVKDMKSACKLPVPPQAENRDNTWKTIRGSCGKNRGRRTWTKVGKAWNAWTVSFFSPLARGGDSRGFEPFGG